MSWKPEVLVDGKWECNGLVFETQDEAVRSAASLFSRWALTTGYRSVKSDESANYRLVDGDLVAIPTTEKTK